MDVHNAIVDIPNYANTIVCIPGTIPIGIKPLIKDIHN